MAGLLLAALVAQALPSSAQLHSLPGIRLRGTVVTMDAAHTVIPDGNVLVRQGRIEAIWSGNRIPPRVNLENVKVVSAGPGGLIFPGLINIHDHPDRGMLPLWLPPSSHVQADLGRPNGTEPYAYRYQWGPPTADAPHIPIEYERLVTNSYNAIYKTLGLVDEVHKYTEARAALGGVTAIQGSDQSGLPVRNVDDANFNFDENHVEDWVRPSVESAKFRDDVAPVIRTAMTDGSLGAWFVHLAEGVRDGARRPGDEVSSRHEFDVIKDEQLLTDATVVVHGTGLEQDDFAEMRAAPPGQPGAPDGVGAKLVWSPLSNLLLYGVTTEIYDAVAEDVTVSLGTDWAPSGSNTLLDELKVADIALRDPRLLGDTRVKVPELADEALLDRTLVDMVTRNPARTLRWSEVGTIAVGNAADLLLLRRPSKTPTGGMPDTPYRSLIDATQRDVALVLVGGDAIAGDVNLMTTLRGNDFDIAKGSGIRKGLDVTEQESDPSLAEITHRLRAGLAALGSNGGTNLEAMQLRPLFTIDDDFFFAILAPRTGRAGLVEDETPPYQLYPANINHLQGGASLFAPAAFFNRWYLFWQVVEPPWFTP